MPVSRLVPRYEPGWLTHYGLSSEEERLSARHVTVIIYSVSRYKVLSSLCNGSRCYLLSSASIACARFAKSPTRSWEPSADASSSIFDLISNPTTRSSCEATLHACANWFAEPRLILFLDLIMRAPHNAIVIPKLVATGWSISLKRNCQSGLLCRVTKIIFQDRRHTSLPQFLLHIHLRWEHSILHCVTIPILFACPCFPKWLYAYWTTRPTGFVAIA